VDHRDGSGGAVLAETFWRRLDGTSDPGSCWHFTGWLDKDGYGVLIAHRRHQRAHRVAWALTHGPIPDGLLVLHTCDRPGCCNPRHLYLGTQADNMADMIDRDRRRSRAQRRAAGAGQLELPLVQTGSLKSMGSPVSS
jgi:hypothetical protein